MNVGDTVIVILGSGKGHKGMYLGPSDMGDIEVVPQGFVDSRFFPADRVMSEAEYNFLQATRGLSCGW